MAIKRDLSYEKQVLKSLKCIFESKVKLSIVDRKERIKLLKSFDKVFNLKEVEDIKEYSLYTASNLITRVKIYIE